VLIAPVLAVVRRVLREARAVATNEGLPEGTELLSRLRGFEHWKELGVHQVKTDRDTPRESA
jgi:hypothetical protein